MRGSQRLRSKELYGQIWHVQRRFGWLVKNILGSKLALEWKIAGNDRQEQWWICWGEVAGQEIEAVNNTLWELR